MRSEGGVALETWAPPTVTAVMDAVFPDDIEVQVFDTSAGPTLVGAIELISPANKDRDENRRTFGAKCASYLQQGIGLMTVDIVTSRRADMPDARAHSAPTSAPAATATAAEWPNNPAWVQPAVEPVDHRTIAAGRRNQHQG